jgi:hypothetical protein
MDDVVAHPYDTAQTVTRLATCIELFGHRRQVDEGGRYRRVDAAVTHLEQRPDL